MKIAPRDIERILRSPAAELRAVLLYGPDGGLIRERARALVVAVAGDAEDPFRTAELASAEIRADPARLADEAAAMSFTGGRRAVRLRDADDALAPAFKILLDAVAGDSLVIVEAGDLNARSSLRRIFEAEASMAALPCYRDDERTLPAVIRASLRAAGLEAAPEALAYLTANLGGDRMITRRELDKLGLYMGTHRGGGELVRIELGDAQACVGDSAALSLDDLAFALGDGDVVALERALARSLREGANPVAILRGTARHLQRLHLVSGLTAQGTPPDAAMKRLRPPPFWKLAPRFRAQVQTWTPPALGQAMDRLLEAERACKRSGAPAEVLCAQALHRIARSVHRSRTGTAAAQR